MMWHYIGLQPDKSACCLQFRFIVDGAWKWADDQPIMRDEEGNCINVLEVHEFVPENLESLSGFEPPPSPPSRCFLLLITCSPDTTQSVEGAAQEHPARSKSCLCFTQVALLQTATAILHLTAFVPRHI